MRITALGRCRWLWFKKQIISPQNQVLLRVWGFVLFTAKSPYLIFTFDGHWWLFCIWRPLLYTLVYITVLTIHFSAVCLCILTAIQIHSQISLYVFTTLGNKANSGPASLSDFLLFPRCPGTGTWPEGWTGYIQLTKNIKAEQKELVH